MLQLHFIIDMRHEPHQRQFQQKRSRENRNQVPQTVPSTAGLKSSSEMKRVWNGGVRVCAPYGSASARWEHRVPGIVQILR